MLYQFGRFCQFAGLIILPIGIAGNIAEELSLKQSLIVSGVGMVIFFLGWALQEWTKPD